MNLQIDVMPEKKSVPGFQEVQIYLDGQCYSLIASNYTINQMKQQKLIKQTRGQRHDENGKLVTFDYPEGHDGAGVQYTSPVFEVIERLLK